MIRRSSWRAVQDARLASLESRLDGISVDLTAVAASLESITTTLAELSDRIDSADRMPNWDRAKWEQIARRILRGKSSMETSLRGLITRDMSALLSLHDLVRLQGEPIQATSFAATPETLLALVGHVAGLPDGAVIVEAGSGLSSMWSALAAKQFGRSISIVSLEHDEGYAETTRVALRRQGVESFVDVRCAPLEPLDPGGADDGALWYAAASHEDLTRIDLLFIDGPPKSVGADVRYPAVPQLVDALVDGAIVILDDTDRPEERACIERWQEFVGAKGGELVVERELDRATQLRYRKDLPSAGG